ncbi:MAG: glycosyltransferase [Bacteroidales bacterium]|jgi:mannosylfructose-phosphate synthase|nr:glycosyltransferase [Bacteroidales bacterium]
MSNIKRIAMLSTHGYFDPVPKLGRTDTGGQVVYVLELAKALTRAGYQTDIYTRWFDPIQQQIDPVPDMPDVRVIRIPAGPWEFIPKEFIYDVLPELANNMVDFIKDNNLEYDLYHGHYVDAGIVALDVARSMGKPVYFTAHSLGAWKRDQMGGDPEEMEKKFNFRHRIAEEIRIFDTVNAQSLTSIVQQEKLKELCDYEADNIEIIPPGVDVHHFYPRKEDEAPLKTELPEKYVFCLSRIDTNKGHDLLLHAWDIVRKEVDDVTLVIGGGSPNPKPRELGVFATMDKIIAEAGMEDRVTRIGYVPNDMMRTYYQQAILFVMPSLFEPFGMTCQEAMACGTPVIASKFGGIRNTIKNGFNGYLVDSANPVEFADAIMELLKDEEKCRLIGQNAYKVILEEYSWEAIARRHLAFYEKYM